MLDVSLYNPTWTPLWQPEICVLGSNVGFDREPWDQSDSSLITANSQVFPLRA